MRHVITIVFVVGVLLMPTAAAADDRLVDGALGAGAGALLFGAPGLVAGAVIGYVAGPRISSAMRSYRRYPHAYYRPLAAQCYERTPYGYTRACGYDY